jgi:hypothetical protein
MMDPADPSYKTHLLTMLATVVSKAPSGNAGLCVDRQDMVGAINPHADDGVTLYQYQGRPKVPVAGRSTFTSHRWDGPQNNYAMFFPAASPVLLRRTITIIVNCCCAFGTMSSSLLMDELGPALNHAGMGIMVR